MRRLSELLLSWCSVEQLQPQFASLLSTLTSETSGGILDLTVDEFGRIVASIGFCQSTLQTSTAIVRLLKWSQVQSPIELKSLIAAPSSSL